MSVNIQLTYSQYVIKINFILMFLVILSIIHHASLKKCTSFIRMFFGRRQQVLANLHFQWIKSLTK